MHDDTADTGSALGTLLEVYADLYPSMRERIRVITQSQDPVVRSKLALLQSLSRRSSERREGDLVRRFGLTRSEARLAAWLCDGGAVASYAKAHKVSVGTARTHLKAIFAKTGVHRQAQLTSLILQGGIATTE